jgi:hypothetical protein
MRYAIAREGKIPDFSKKSGIGVSTRAKSLSFGSPTGRFLSKICWLIELGIDDSFFFQCVEHQLMLYQVGQSSQ